MTMALTVAVCATMPAHACDIDRWQPHITEASHRYGIAEEWIRAMMRAESAGCTHLDGRPITSHAGAMGLMQLMPATWNELRQRHGFGTDAYDPRENILAGTAYLRELTDRFGVPGAFAAYHAGPRRYEAHRTQGAPLPLETRRYLSQVSADANITDAVSVTEQVAVARVDPLFAVVARSHPRQETDDTPPSDSRLFVRLQHGRDRVVKGPSDPQEESHAHP
jgi:soluble lytic murein transglycosylase-like protein